MLNSGYCKSEIARKIERSRNTICYEIKRNSANQKYEAVKANEKYRHRMEETHGSSIEKNEELLQYVTDKLIKAKWSPDAISGRIRLEGKIKSVSTETIYNFIYFSSVAKKLSLSQYLHTKRGERYKRGSRKRRAYIIDRISIKDRDAEANKKVVPGHFEMDLTFHKGNKSLNIGTMVDKATQKIILVEIVENHIKSLEG